MTYLVFEFVLGVVLVMTERHLPGFPSSLVVSLLHKLLLFDELVLLKKQLSPFESVLENLLLF